jgi:hypothetical protein
MNLVLADTEEFRRTRRRTKAAPGASQQVTETEERRAIGLTIIRGAHVISLSVDGPPPADPAARLGGASGAPSTAATLAQGHGVTRPTARGALPAGLTGPAIGVGGPGPGFGAPPFAGGPPGFGGPPPGFGGRGGPPGGPRKLPARLNCKSLLTPRSWLPSCWRTPWLRWTPRVRRTARLPGPRWPSRLWWTLKTQKLHTRIESLRLLCASGTTQESSMHAGAQERALMESERWSGGICNPLRQSTRALRKARCRRCNSSQKSVPFWLLHRSRDSRCMPCDAQTIQQITHKFMHQTVFPRASQNHSYTHPAAEHIALQTLPTSYNSSIHSAISPVSRHLQRT